MTTLVEPGITCTSCALPDVGNAAVTALVLPNAIATAALPVFVIANCWAGVSTVTSTLLLEAPADKTTEGPVA